MLPISPAEQARRKAQRDQPMTDEDSTLEMQELATEYCERYKEKNKQLWRLFNIRDPDLMMKAEYELKTRRHDEHGFVKTRGERYDALAACCKFIHSNFRHGPEEKRKFEDMLRFVAGEFYDGEIVKVCQRLQHIEWRMKLLIVRMEWLTVREVSTVCSERHLNLADDLRPRFI